MLIEMEIAPFFAFMVISGKEGVEKPDPAIFRLALERSGVAPEEAVFVGDHPRLDVEAASKLAMTGVLIDRPGRYDDFEGLGLRPEDLDRSGDHRRRRRCTPGRGSPCSSGRPRGAGRRRLGPCCRTGGCPRTRGGARPCRDLVAGTARP